jgi:hypothetical protein
VLLQSLSRDFVESCNALEYSVVSSLYSKLLFIETPVSSMRAKRLERCRRVHPAILCVNSTTFVNSDGCSNGDSSLRIKKDPWDILRRHISAPVKLVIGQVRRIDKPVANPNSKGHLACGIYKKMTRTPSIEKVFAVGP